MDEKIIHQFRKNRTEELICTLKTWNGKTFFDIRVFYRNEQNELKPTAKGICLPVDKIFIFKSMVTHLERLSVNTIICK